MNKIFLDCGFYVGNILKIYAERGIIDKTWTIYAFEVNPELEVEKMINEFPVDLNIKWIKKAVWIKDEEVEFQIGGRNDASSIKGTAGHGDPKIYKVQAIDFSKFVADLPEDSYIICSMDVEGAEFMVLKKMLKEHTIDKINELDIEFHHRLMLDYTDKDAEELIKPIKERGVKLSLKVPLR